MHNALLLLQRIPRGRVTTYGELARAAGTSPRAVGQILRRNERPDICPCYKVVASGDRIGGYNGSVKGNDINRKISLLRRDGINIVNGRIDLETYLYKFRNTE